MLIKKLGIKKLGQAGDTIIEVLIAIVILSLALGIAYNVAIKDTSNTQLTQERSEALQLAQTQIEFLRANGSANDKTDFSTPISDSCFNSAGTPSTSSSCNPTNPGGLPYNINVSVNTTSPNGGASYIYTIVVSWDSTASGYKYNVTLYYEI